MLDTLARGATSMLARSWRLSVIGEDHVRAVRREGRPLIFVLWHDQLLAPLWHRRGEGITLLVSGHQDGGRLARAAAAWGYRTERGSSTRGAVGGLRGLVRALRRGGAVAITPDGPRGPARQLKPGAVAAARWSGGVLIPVAAAATPVWRARSWDRMAVPRPGARVRVAYGAPVDLPAGGPLEEDLLRVTQALMEVEQCARN